MKTNFIFTLIMVLVFLSGCLSATNSFNINEADSPLTPKALAPNTQILIQPSVTATFATPLPPTFTPYPKLTSDESVKVLFELMKDNGNCRLPCLLGYSPEIAAPQELKIFFGQFISVDSPDISINKVLSSNRKVNAVGFYLRHLDVYFDIAITLRQATC